MTADQLIELAARAQALYDKCKIAPERDAGAMVALIELRNLTPDLIAALNHAAAREAEFIELPRLTLGKQG